MATVTQGARIVGLTTILALTLIHTRAHAVEEPVRRLVECTEVVREIVAIPEKGIPPVLLRNAQGIAIIPSVIKVGFVLGGRFGKGAVLVRKETGDWSAPVLVQLVGGSVGWQVGAQSTDVVLVFKSKESIDGLLAGKVTLGGDATVAAGPVGRHVEAATDPKLDAEVFSYSRSRGLFAGVSLQGTVLQIDAEANEVVYGRPVTPRELRAEKVSLPTQAEELRSALEAALPKARP
jgi:lipid-binding SYLF domain-containing protein